MHQRKLCPAAKAARPFQLWHVPEYQATIISYMQMCSVYFVIKSEVRYTMTERTRRRGLPLAAGVSGNSSVHTKPRLSIRHFAAACTVQNDTLKCFSARQSEIYFRTEAEKHGDPRKSTQVTFAKYFTA